MLLKLLLLFPGIAHLEALEELSRWSSETLGKQLSGLKGKSADAVRDDLALINDSFHLGDFSDVTDGAFVVICFEFYYIQNVVW